VTTDRAGYAASVSGVAEEQQFEVECPHCHKTFAGERIEGGRAARYRGFKCPHCKLFVPLQRATDSGLSRARDAAS
jgi:transposase-like protein